MLNLKSILATGLALGLTACSVGPRYKQPTVALPQQFTAPDSTTVDSSSRADANDPEFWHSFNDPELSSLVERSLTANNDLHAALAHYDSANALLREVKFDRYPTVTMSTSVGRQKFGADQAFGYPRNNRFFTPGINASWELDFFGRVRHNIEAQRQTYAVSRNFFGLREKTLKTSARPYNWSKRLTRLAGEQSSIPREHVPSLRQRPRAFRNCSPRSHSMNTALPYCADLPQMLSPLNLRG
jgi:multidrug efflux system outer membrane protein